MSKLILTFNGKTESEHPLTKEITTIGRHSNNDITVDNLAVSGHHAQVLKILDDCFLEDLNSSNGTYVNGELIKKHALKDGDQIKIGKHQLRFIQEVVEQGEGDFEKTMIIRPDSAGMPESAGDTHIDQHMGKIAASLAAEHKEAKHTTAIGKASLQLLSGTNSGKQLPISKALTTLGKPGVQVAAITRRPTGYYIIHVEGGAKNGHPTVNGEDIGSQAHPLSNNDIIEVAGVKMEFCLDEA